MTNAATPCPFGTTHRHVGPIPKTKVSTMRAMARAGTRLEWIASHFGITVRRVQALTAKKPKARRSA